jgi:hypothetical protein
MKRITIPLILLSSVIIGCSSVKPCFKPICHVPEKRQIVITDDKSVVEAINILVERIQQQESALECYERSFK